MAITFDDLGPQKVVEVYHSKLKFHGFLVIDNTALGVGKGGIRMTPTVTVEEVFQLARVMTYKTAMAKLPLGGAKSGIVFDPKKASLKEKYEVIKAFSKLLKVHCPAEYIAAPDVNTGEKEMEIFAKANGDLNACTGKPKKLGGIPHELGSAGYGVFYAAQTASNFLNLDLKKLSFAIEGFGTVGKWSAKYLTEFGAKLVAVSDSKGTIYNSAGIRFNELLKIKKTTGTVTNYPGQILKPEEIVSLPIDILITAAVPYLINESNVDKIKAKLIVEGSNIPATWQAEEILHKKGILVIPDFVANAGGVISSYVELQKGTEKDVFRLVKRKITRATKATLEKSKSENISPRQAAIKIARERLLKVKV